MTGDAENQAVNVAELQKAQEHKGVWVQPKNPLDTPAKAAVVYSSGSRLVVHNAEVYLFWKGRKTAGKKKIM